MSTDVASSSAGAANVYANGATSAAPAVGVDVTTSTETRDAVAAPSNASATIAAAAALFDPTRAPESGLQHVPRDARLMALILQSMGIQDVQPPALMMLLEFAHRYLYEVLQDAIVYADHAGTGRTAVGGISTLSLDDIQLAIQGRVNHSFTGPPNKEMLLSLASSLNSVPLPPISDRYGVKLPPTQHCLTNVNFSIVPNSPPRDDELLDEEEAEDDGEGGGVAPLADVGAGDDSDGDNDGEADETNAADTTMTGAANGVTGTQGQASEGVGADTSAQRGTKRTLDEDDDYD